MKRILFILLTIASFTASAQVTDTAVFAINDNYIFTCAACGIYPKVYQTKAANTNHNGWKNVDTYGAKGNGTTVDNAAIASAFAAAKTAGTGVIFTSGKTYLMNGVINLSIGNTDTVRVWAYGATIKEAALSGGTLFQISHASGSKGGGVLWFGGTFDGDQQHQRYPYNATGGTYDTRAQACDANNQGFDESHSCLLAAVRAGLAVFKDVNFDNVLLDGLRVEECKLAIVADGKATNGAPVHENNETQYSSTPGVCEQGSYWKFRVIDSGDETAYFLNLDGEGGSIGIQFSFPEPADKSNTMPHNTVGVIANCRFWNQAQDNIHLEDCYKNYIYNTTWGADAVGNYMPRCWVSNRTGIASFKNCTAINGWINFVNAASLQLGFVDKCTFISEYTSTNNKCQYFINKASHVTNSSFTGRASTTQVDAQYSKGNRFINFNAKALTSAIVSDNDFFQNGTNPVTLAGSGHIYRATSSSVTGLQANSTWSSSVDNPFNSKLYIVNQANKFLGQITVGQ